MPVPLQCTAGVYRWVYRWLLLGPRVEFRGGGVKRRAAGTCREEVGAHTAFRWLGVLQCT